MKLTVNDIATRLLNMEIEHAKFWDRLLAGKVNLSESPDAVHFDLALTILNVPEESPTYSRTWCCKLLDDFTRNCSLDTDGYIQAVKAGLKSRLGVKGQPITKPGPATK